MCVGVVLVPTGRSVGALEMCMEVLSELESSTGVSEFVERQFVCGSSPVPPQLLACCSPFPGSFSGESRMTHSTP